MFMVKNIYLKTLYKNWFHIFLTEQLAFHTLSLCLLHFKCPCKIIRRCDFCNMMLWALSAMMSNDKSFKRQVTLHFKNWQVKVNLHVAAAHYCEAVVSPWQSQSFGPPSKGRKRHLTFLIRQFSVSQVVRVLHSSSASSTPAQVGSDPGAALTVIE